MKLIEEFKNWLDLQYHYSDNTKKSYLSGLSKVNLSSPFKLQKSLKKLKETDADRTFNNRINALRLLNEFLEEEYPDNEMIETISNLKRIKNPVSISYPPYSKDEVNTILDFAKGWKRQALYIAANSGLRKSEIRKLNVDDIDLEHGWIYVRKGKHNKARRVAIAGVQPLIRWKKFRDLTNIEDDKIGSPWLFSREGKRPHIESNIIFKKLEEKTGIKITMHRFRAFYATELYRKTKDAVLVKEQLGHESLDTTMRYIHQFSHERADKIRDAGRLA